MCQKIIDIDKDNENDKKSISENKNFLKSLEKKSKNENKDLNHKESLHKENHNTKNNNENK